MSSSASKDKSSADKGNKDTEKMKVLQSIASVIQALAPAEQIPPVEVSYTVTLISSPY